MSKRRGRKRGPSDSDVIKHGDDPNPVVIKKEEPEDEGDTGLVPYELERLAL